MCNIRQAKTFFASLVLFALLGGTGYARTYSTDFNTNEDPISEGGNWINGRATGLDWHNVIVNGGKAYGEVANEAYSDPTALLTGSWGADQTITATVYMVNENDSLWQEVELRLRSTMTAHSCTGYEVLFSARSTTSAYIQIVRWNGPVGSFTYLKTLSGVSAEIHNGDVVKASVIGNTITAYVNGVQKLSATDSTYTSGNPGIGFDYGVGSTGPDFGFTSFTATDGPVKIPKYPLIKSIQ